MEPANVEKFPPNQLELASNNELLQLGLQPRGGLSNPKNSIIESESEVEEDIYDDCPDGKGYELQYWYGTPDNIVRSELIADGTSKGKSVKKATLKYHYKPEE